MTTASEGGFSGEISGDATTGRVSAKADVSGGAIAAIGRAAKWLLPVHDVNVKLMSAASDRLSEKIRDGLVLDDQEAEMLNLICRREVIRIANRADVIDRVHDVLPEISTNVKNLPAQSSVSTTDTFLGRAEQIAGEIHEPELRALFARVLAGELVRPGAFSIRTLETVRSLDPAIAAAFERLRAHTFNCEWVLQNPLVLDPDNDGGITVIESGELRDAGLLSAGIILLHSDTKDIPEFRCGPLVMRFTFSNNEDFVPKVGIANYRLTRVGRELASVLPPIVDRDNFFAIGKGFSTAFPSTVMDWQEDGSGTWQKF